MHYGKIVCFFEKNVFALVVVIWWIVTLVACGYGLFYDNAIVAWVGMGMMIVGFGAVMRIVYLKRNNMRSG